jgi:hypothetical protein
VDFERQECMTVGSQLEDEHAAPLPSSLGADRESRPSITGTWIALTVLQLPMRWSRAGSGEAVAVTQGSCNSAVQRTGALPGSTSMV